MKLFIQVTIDRIRVIKVDRINKKNRNLQFHKSDKN